MWYTVSWSAQNPSPISAKTAGTSGTVSAKPPAWAAAPRTASRMQPATPTARNAGPGAADEAIALDLAGCDVARHGRAEPEVEERREDRARDRDEQDAIPLGAELLEQDRDHRQADDGGEQLPAVVEGAVADEPPVRSRVGTGGHGRDACIWPPSTSSGGKRVTAYPRSPQMRLQLLRPMLVETRRDTRSRCAAPWPACRRERRGGCRTRSPRRRS